MRATQDPGPVFWATSACFDLENADVFFPEPHDLKSVKRARELCAACPWLVACAEKEFNKPVVTDFGVIAGVLVQNASKNDRKRVDAELKSVMVRGRIPARTGSPQTRVRLARVETVQLALEVSS